MRIGPPTGRLDCLQGDFALVAEGGDRLEVGCIDGVTRICA
jgi:hypothetical protein